MAAYALVAAIICWGVAAPVVEAIGFPPQQTAFLRPPSTAMSPLQHTIRCNRQQQHKHQPLSALRKPFVGGNWKCNGTVEGAAEILQMLNDAPPEVDDVEVSCIH